MFLFLNICETAHYYLGSGFVSQFHQSRIKIFRISYKAGLNLVSSVHPRLICVMKAKPGSRGGTMLSQAEVILTHTRSRLSSTDHEVEHRFTDAEMEKSVKIYIYTALN